MVYPSVFKVTMSMCDLSVGKYSSLFVKGRNRELTVTETVTDTIHYDF